MRVSLIAVGQRMPAWIQQGFGEYTQRLKARLPLHLVEVPAVRRGGGDLARAVEEEGRRLLSTVKPDHYVVALDERGKMRSSVELSQWLGRQLQEGRDLCFLVGGADGFAPQVLQRADERWSLSALTLPHALVRVVFAEQIYRAVTLLDGHPYHRE
jgi:23S rRNA (pseudouridine1915-N3)-methyltransferase